MVMMKQKAQNSNMLIIINNNEQTNDVAENLCIKISDILDFSPGTIIELNKIAGEPIDVLVNGKYVAKGEVVVIEESFGIRITEIMK
jgi:flagellar motor switch protein FliN